MSDTAITAVPSFPLFVPADRPDRFAKACAAGTDTVIIDVEDAVAPDSKVAVRRIPEGALPRERTVRLYLRVNAVDTPWYRDDVAFARAMAFDGVVLPKAESAAQVAALREALEPGRTILALIETVAGLAAIDEIARAADQIAFGSIDFAEDMGCAHTRQTLLPIRSRVVMAARLAGRPAPIDGVTPTTTDTALMADDAKHSNEMGFGGKLLIHPHQIAPSRAAFRPDAGDLDWANRVLSAAKSGATVVIDGAMVDAPIVARARRILARERALT